MKWVSSPLLIGCRISIMSVSVVICSVFWLSIKTRLSSSSSLEPGSKQVSASGSENFFCARWLDFPLLALINLPVWMQILAFWFNSFLFLATVLAFLLTICVSSSLRFFLSFLLLSMLCMLEFATGLESPTFFWSFLTISAEMRTFNTSYSLLLKFFTACMGRIPSALSSPYLAWRYSSP